MSSPERDVKGRFVTGHRQPKSHPWRHKPTMQTSKIPKNIDGLKEFRRVSAGYRSLEGVEECQED